ncbi:hypothetical protein REPUB_Repub15cG0138500 [Reevesia pubescens]
MEGSILQYSLLFLLSIFVIKLFHHQTKPRNKKIPPSPPSLPFLGHIHLLKGSPHRSLLTLLQKYGPILSLKLGSRLVVVVSSPSAVEECFTKNDIIFANRPDLWSGKHGSYDFTTLGFTPYGDHWRNLRRICKVELLSSNRLNMSSDLRRDEIKILLKKLYHASNYHSFTKVELKPLLSQLLFHIIMRMIGGNQYNGETERKEAKKLAELIDELSQLGNSGAIGVFGDFFPYLQWVDYKGYKKNVLRINREKDELLQGLVDENRRKKCAFGSENTMINYLLSLQESQPNYYTDEILKGLLQDMLTAGIDTSIITVEWAMSSLLNNPSSLAKLRAELESHVSQEKLLDESDLPKLGYLQNIVSETFRLYPPAPLLIPHMSSADCTLGGYDIAKGTWLLVNAWAIHRDPKLWDEPNIFKPERFENGGENEGYKLLPFGAGRRSCPGMDLGRRVVGLTLGSLIQCFEWKRVGEDQEIDMTEGTGITMPKAEPLQALFKPRNMANKLLS